MSLSIVYKVIKDARKEHCNSRNFCQAMIIVVIASLIIFGICTWKTQNYYFAFGEVLATAIRPLLKQMGKLSGDNVKILQQSGKMIENAPNQNKLVEDLKIERESDRQRR